MRRHTFYSTLAVRMAVTSCNFLSCIVCASVTVVHECLEDYFRGLACLHCLFRRRSVMYRSSNNDVSKVFRGLRGCGCRGNKICCIASGTLPLPPTGYNLKIWHEFGHAQK